MFSGFGNFSQPSFGFGAAKFEDYFRCYPIVMMPDLTRKDDANFGGKIFLPPSALNRLTMLHIRYPMLFELTSEESGLNTHSGVLEFTAEEGRAYLPQWMMSTLQIQPGSLLKIANIDLPLGSFVKIEPQSVDFLDISDPKAVLENVLRKFTTLTVHDIIEVNYNDTVYGVKILEVKPDTLNHGICVVETDLETDFAPPVGYVEPEYKPTVKAPANPAKTEGTMAKSINFAKLASDAQQNDPFGGNGQKLSGKAVETPTEIQQIPELNPDAPPAPLVLPVGQLFFGFPIIPVAEEQSAENGEETKVAFSGEGQSLRASRKRKDKNGKFPSIKNLARSPEMIEID